MSLAEKRDACRELGLPTTGSKKDLDQRIKDHMERNHTPPTEFTTQAIPLSDFKCNSLSENDIEYPARKAMEKAADEATVDHSTEPVRWGNSQGLTVLEKLEMLVARVQSLEDVQKQNLSLIAENQSSITALESDVAALKGTTESFFAVRCRFFAVFIRDKVGKISRADQNLINEGNFAAHGGDPLTDAMMFQKGIRKDERIFMLLYGMTWQRVMKYAENQPVLKVLGAHATALAKGPSIATLQDKKTELGIFEAAFDDFIAALEDGGFPQDFLDDLQAPEAVMYWQFWKQQRIYEEFLSSTKSGDQSRTEKGKNEEGGGR